MVFSNSEINFCITGLLTELRTVPFAIWQGVLQRHTSQNNQPHLPTARIQIFSEMPVC